MNAVDRFSEKVRTGPGCWEWTASKTENGYGHFRLDGRLVLAHRLAYEWLVGPIPVGLTLDHLCRVRHCVRPDHLEPVTNRENILRGESFSGRACAGKTHCPAGHPYDEANTYLDPRGWRNCRVCRCAAGAAAYRRKKLIDV